MLSEAFSLGAGASHEVTVTLRRATYVTLPGIVTTAKGEPIEGARVLLNGEEKARTDADGRFSIPGVSRRNGWTQLSVQAEGYATIFRRQDLPSEGDVQEVRVELRATSPISGRVVDQDGAPVKDAYVDLVRLGGNVPYQPSVRTDADGRFELLNATAQEFNLRVIPPQPYWAWKQSFQKYTVVRGGQRDIVVELQRLEPGKARVVVRVKDWKTGDPIKPLEAMFIRKDDGKGLPAPQPTIEEGRVVIEGVHPGSYLLWVRAADRPAGYAALAVGETDREVEGEISIIEKDGLGIVRGRVDFGDHPRPKTVFVATALVSAWTQPMWASGGGAKTDHSVPLSEDGTFEIRGVLPGRWSVSIAALKGWKAVEHVNVKPGEAYEVVLRPEQVATLRLEVEKIPAGTRALRFLVSPDGEDWDLDMNLGGLKVGGHASHTSTLEPGHWYWKVEFDADNIVGGRRRSAETQVGEVDLVRGQAAKVQVPVKPRCN